MPIQQTIKYESTNKYFAGFLEYILNESKLKGSISQGNDEIVLLIDDKDQKKLETFSKITSKYLPHSIFLGEIRTKTVDEEIQEKPLGEIPYYDIALCYRCLDDLTRPSSDKYLDDTITCTHYGNKKADLEFDKTLYSPHYSNGSTLLVCNASKVDDLFIMTDNEKKALFSIEKPSIKVTIKDEELKKMTNKNFLYIKSPSNIKSSLAALNAEDSEVDYLFFEDNNETKAIVIQGDISLIKDTRVTSKLENFDENKDVNRFLNIANEMGNKDDAICANLSRQNGISFMASNDMGYKKVMSFQEFSLETLLIDMKNDENKSKLLINFENKFTDIMSKLHANKEYDLFESLCVILELDELGFNSLSNKSLEFRGNGGLKIDMNFDDDGFDYVSFFGSIMSFKLALVNASHLAYSIFEGYGDMTISNLGQIKKKFKIENIIIMGDIFENSVLYSRILSKYKSAKPFFSKKFALDD